MKDEQLKLEEIEVSHTLGLADSARAHTQELQISFSQRVFQTYFVHFPPPPKNTNVVL